jgi:hypothetical protein
VFAKILFPYINDIQPSLTKDYINYLDSIVKREKLDKKSNKELVKLLELFAKILTIQY